MDSYYAVVVDSDSMTSSSSSSSGRVDHTFSNVEHDSLELRVFASVAAAVSHSHDVPEVEPVPAFPEMENLMWEDRRNGFEQKSRIKRPRASPPEPENDVETDFDERNNPLSANYVPPGFLSPSVIEYLELGKSIPGRPGSDYPVLGTVPYTNFYCDEQPYPGFFADPETRCQTWHYCDIDGRQTTFLCPNGTQFSQLVFVCDWWFNVRCDLSEKLYIINSRLYGRPKLDPTRPHRTITKQLLEDIFNDEDE